MKKENLYYLICLLVFFFVVSLVLSFSIAWAKRVLTNSTMMEIRGGTNNPPDAVAIPPSTAIWEGDSVSFSGGYSSDPDGDDLTFHWDFDDGNTSNEMNPSHTYTTADKYTAVLTVTDPYQASDTDSCSVTVVKVDMQDIKAVVKNKTKNISVNVTPSNPGETITLELSTISGTGSATFYDDTTSKTITDTTTVTVKGVTESSVKDNIKLAAKLYTGYYSSDQELFCVPWVTISVKTSGTLAQDNAARGEYYSRVDPHSYNLGNGVIVPSDPRLGWGVEVTGTVSPSNFDDDIKLERDAQCKTWKGMQGNILGFTKYFSSIPPGNDTGPSYARDDDPQSGGSNGKIYDFDYAGHYISQNDPQNYIRRARWNFKTFATYEGQICSSIKSWYIRLSWYHSGPGLSDWSQKNDVQGDNTTGNGTTSLDWDL